MEALAWGSLMIKRRGPAPWGSSETYGGQLVVTRSFNAVEALNILKRRCEV